MRGVVNVKLTPFFVGLTSYFVIVLVGGKLGLCSKSLTVNTFKVIGHVMFLFIVVIVKLGRKVRPVTNCGFNTRGCRHIGRMVGCAIVTTAVIAADNFLINRLVPRLTMTTFAASSRLVRLDTGNLEMIIVFFPVVNFRVIASGFFRDVKVTGGTVVLSLDHRMLVLVPYLLVLPLF